MRAGQLSRAALSRYVLTLFFVLPLSVGCHRAFVLRGSCGFDWMGGDCENCDDCRPQRMPHHVYRTAARQSCQSCGEVGCIPGKCRKRAPGSWNCGGKYPNLFQAFGLGCKDPRKYGGGYYPPEHGDDLSPWSHEGPGSFHPVPTRPVFGPQPTLADPRGCQDPVYQEPAYREPMSQEEGPSDPGLETIPLKDMPRNLDTPSDPRNLIPPPEDVQPDASDYPTDESASGQKKLHSVSQTAWRPRGSASR